MAEEFKFKKKQEGTTEMQCIKCGAWFSVPENPFIPGIPKAGDYACPKCKNIIHIGGGSFFVGKPKGKAKEKKENT